MKRILELIDSPAELKRLGVAELTRLAAELREYIIAVVSQNGGHLAPSLGTVELTLALHSVYNSPRDKIVWDVGHQAYAHKILTGRREAFRNLRQKDGITGFPKRKESPHDAFGVGHASTSISAALGLAIARDLRGEKSHVVAVIGDGALTGGEAFEALNHAGDLGKNLVVVLNDNAMSIDKNVGALSEYLSQVRLTPKYIKAKRDVESLILSIPHIGDRVLRTASQIKDGVRSALIPGSLFEEMGFHYVGPLDGHNIELMLEVFAKVRSMTGPILVHVHTKKGKGYLPAEISPDAFHGIGAFEVATGKAVKSCTVPTYTQIFGDTLVELGEKNEKLVAITAAMPTGTGLKKFGELFPQRFFDVGIAEEHAVTLAAGLAAGGARPVAAIYSTFLQRAYDQILHDVCLQNLPVTLCLDRAGIVGEDGATHHGVFDLSYLRHIPHLSLLAPKDENELRQMLKAAIEREAPVAIRYPRGAGLGVKVQMEFQPLPWGKAEILEGEGDIAFLAIGSMVHTAEVCAARLREQGLTVRVANMRFVKPLDEELIKKWATETKGIVTLEENILAGGFGSAVLETLQGAGINLPVLRFGIGDDFVEQGTRQELFAQCGLLPEQIVEKVLAMMGARTGDENGAG
ncbi:MAG: 1-deoxy-D-xylulose-5-phosphate synthase [Selenomonadaceae bacterium]|nr:1-deoxy-D-xylulose-5-phosphate synthase [Selenomonadaceae bacterium]